MKITYKDKHEDPDHPIMHGDTPLAKEFNKRQQKIREDGKFDQFTFEQVATVLIEILSDDYNEVHGLKRSKKKSE